MKRWVSLFSALFITLVLSGCGSTGKNFPTGPCRRNPKRRHHPIPNPRLVRRGLQGRRAQRQSAMWTYQFDTYNSLGIGKDRSKELVILFDKDHIVRAYRYASNMD